MAEGSHPAGRGVDRPILVCSRALRVMGNHDDGPSAGTQHPRQLAHGRVVIADVLEHVGSDHGVEGAVPERQVRQVRLHIGVRVEQIDRGVT